MKHTRDMCSCGIYDHDTGTRKVKISELHDFEGHPFKVEQLMRGKLHLQLQWRFLILRKRNSMNFMPLWI